MADNYVANPGTGGDTFAADDVTTLNGGASSGVKVPRVKLMIGADGTATDVAAGAGAVAAGVPRMTLASDDPAVVDLAAIEVLLTTLNSLVSGEETAATNATSTADENDRVLKAGAGRLFGLTGFNGKASAQYIQIHDAASAPADTAVPKITFKVQADSPFSLHFGSRGRSFATGIYICNSSTRETKTIGSDDCWFDAQVSA